LVGADKWQRNALIEVTQVMNPNLGGFKNGKDKSSLAYLDFSNIQQEVNLLQCSLVEGVRMLARSHSFFF
jgi:hypothetical protein